MLCRGLVDPMALLQEEVGAEHIGVHHNVQKYGHNVGYLPRTHIYSSNIWNVYIAFIEASDDIKA